MIRHRWILASIALVIASGAAFAACGSGDADDGDDDPFAGTPAATAPPATPGSPEPRPTSGVATTVAIDADASTPQVDAAASFPAGTEFSATVVVQRIGGPYHGYQFDVGWDSAVLAYVRVENLTPAGLTFCSPVRTFDDSRVVAFCANGELIDQQFEGPVSRIVLRCNAPGESTLHFALGGEVTSNPERRALGTSVILTREEGEVIHDLTLSDATVTCT